ncbi:MAG: serine/threonine-protein kinase [Myxococcota bacterium]
MNDELQDGDTLGDFRIVRRLGAGAMGVVYEAVEVSLQRTVALKVLPLEVSANPSRRARFLREARAAAAVTHPAVVAIYQIGASDGRDFIAMELVRGRNLRQVLADGPLSIARAVRLAQAIASGLGRAHEAGVVHRDVKPDNVMVTPDDGVKVLDFGIARIDPASFQPSDKRPGESDKNPPPVTALTGEGHLIGTPGYMAPEQSRGATIDARADVFALGAMMYEMLSGLRPFSGDTPLAVIISSARDDVPPLLGVRGDVPPALAAVVDRCLAKDPNDRFPNGRAVADALADVALPKRGDDAVALMLDTIDAPPPTGAPRSPIASTCRRCRARPARLPRPRRGARACSPSRSA